LPGATRTPNYSHTQYVISMEHCVCVCVHTKFPLGRFGAEQRDRQDFNFPDIHMRKSLGHPPTGLKITF
jgi:hypothetical protein